MNISVLFIGDVVGEPGLAALAKWLPELLAERQYDIVIANGENVSKGRGITVKQVKELLHLGVHVITGGNHTFDREKVPEVFEKYSDVVLRPANYPPEVMGNGSTIYRINDEIKIGIINLQGRLFMTATDNPFTVGDKIVASLANETNLIFIDFHAEATAEKIALARHFDGKVSAVVGTHTHVQTADAEIFPGGTAFMCDAGMTGSFSGVIGMKADVAISKIRLGVAPNSAPASGDMRLHGVAIELDSVTGKALSIHPIQRKETVS